LTFIIITDPITKVAFGVEFIRDRKFHYVRAKKEVILSAGAVNTPQLLMLSGIGSKTELLKHRIPLIKDSPGVGENLYDHVMTYASSLGMHFIIISSCRLRLAVLHLWWIKKFP